LTKLTNCLTTEEASESYSSRSSEPNFPALEIGLEIDARGTLRDAIKTHCSLERASFHTPGHKGRARRANLDLVSDVTELPGLDDLSNPTGVLANLNRRAAAIWNTRSSLVSINGASAGIIAAIMSVSPRGKKLVVPRNAHKSVITGLVLSGLEPIWYEPEWNNDWGVFEDVIPSVLAAILNQEVTRHETAIQEIATQQTSEPEAGRQATGQQVTGQQVTGQQATGQHATGELATRQQGVDASIAAVVVVSPTYAGAYSDIRGIREICRKAGIALIVDEAHGAHNISPSTALPAENHSPSAIKAGADVVIHSLHKTLGAMTQTGLVHVPHGSMITDADLAYHLTMLQSTSPSYPLLLSIEDSLNDFGKALESRLGSRLESKSGNELGHELSCSAMVERINHIATTLRLRLNGSALQVYDTAYGTDSWHLLLRHKTKSSRELFEHLSACGVYTECELGDGVLLMLGVGTIEDDIEVLLDALQNFDAQNDSNNRLASSHNGDGFVFNGGSDCRKKYNFPIPIDQVLSPRIASMAPSHQISIADAENLIASECIAPCPPGIPICVPGQRLTKEVLNQIGKDHVRTVATNNSTNSSR
jgi:arginine decarboxylase